MIKNKLFAVLVLMSITSVVAAPDRNPSEVFETVKTVIGFGLEGSFRSSDLDGKTTLTAAAGKEDSVLNGSTVYLFELPALPIWTFTLGGFLDAHNVNLEIAWSNLEGEHGSRKSEVDYFRMGFDYRYRFNYPERWQPHLGAGFAFSFWDIQEGMYVPQLRKVIRAKISGNSMHAEAGYGYYGDYVATVLNVGYRFNMFGKIGSDEGYFETKGYLQEHDLFTRLEVKVFF